MNTTKNIIISFGNCEHNHSLHTAIYCVRVCGVFNLDHLRSINFYDLAFLYINLSNCSQPLIHIAVLNCGWRKIAIGDILCLPLSHNHNHSLSFYVFHGTRIIFHSLQSYQIRNNITNETYIIMQSFVESANGKWARFHDV